MPGLPILKPRELIRLLEGLGFRNSRRRGSHFRFVHTDGRRTTVPVHSGKTIGRGLLRVILDDIGISPAELKKLLKRS